MASRKTQPQPSRRESILDAAAQLFADEGFASTNSQRIADRAGVAAGLVYYHFETKQEILETLLAERTLAPLVMEIVADADRQEPRETLRRMGTTVLRGVASRQDIARILWQETRLNDPERRYLPDLYLRMRERIVDAVGEAVGGAVPVEVVRMRVEAFQSTVLLAAIFGPPENPEGYIDALIEVVWPA